VALSPRGMGILAVSRAIACLEAVKEEEIVEQESAQRDAGPKVLSRRHGLTVIGLAHVGGIIGPWLLTRTLDRTCGCACRRTNRNTCRCEGDQPAFVGSHQVDGYAAHPELGGNAVQFVAKLQAWFKSG